MLIILCFCCAWAELAVIPENVPRPSQRQKDAGQDYKQAN